MNRIIDIVGDKVRNAYEQAGIDPSFGRVTLSNRPDLCEYQSSGCLAAAKKLKQNPMALAEAAAEQLKSDDAFAEVTAAAPGFINMKLSSAFLAEFIREMLADPRMGLDEQEQKRIVLDFGGANVAKPLHIGHLRSAIIGEALKRLGRYMGHEVIGDIHMGDWGLQMGLIIEELKIRKPELPYFDERFTGEYPSEAPFTISELEEIYPAASARAKEDEAFALAAHEATLKLQSGYAPYRAIWKHIMNVSVADLKKNYDRLDVHFDLWKGESDVQELIPPLIEDLEKSGIAYESEGALIVDVAEEGDSREIPPCIIRKSDGAALYATSDLATLVERERDIEPDDYIYITDMRQSLHFTQFFRVSRKAGIVPPEHSLTHIGFGTMNGKDGKPFKTRAGGVMRLEHLIADTEEAVYQRILDNREISEEEARETAKTVALAAIKYGDLSNQAAKDYVFDLDRFTSFEGNTGPYILYSIVRIKSILGRYKAEGGSTVKASDILPSASESEKKLELELVKFNQVIEEAWEGLAPHIVCRYMFGVAESFNSFYHEVKILTEEDEALKKSYLAKLELTKNILTVCSGILGFSAPERM